MSGDKPYQYKELEKQLIGDLKKVVGNKKIGDLQKLQEQVENTLKILNSETEPVTRVLKSSWTMSEDEVADLDTYPLAQDFSELRDEEEEEQEVSDE